MVYLVGKNNVRGEKYNFMWILDELSKLKNSNQIAIIHREKQITFKELWKRSEKIASYIDERCITKAPVAIYGNKEIDIITIM